MSISPSRAVFKTYPRYTWVGNRIPKDAMAEMYKIRKATGKPITRQVAEAVKIYLTVNTNE
jgi:hypothetical protein